MKTLQLLRLTFDTEIAPWETPDFRGAVMDFMGWESVGLPGPALHSRKGENGRKPAAQQLADSIFPYPLAQFKSLRRGASYQPLMLCLGEEATALRAHFLANQESFVWARNRSYSMRISREQLYTFRLRPRSLGFSYRLFKYQALNQENYRAFQQIETEAGKRQFLAKLLANHLLTFARAVGWQLKVPVTVTSLSIIREQPVPDHGIPRHCFDLQFHCNLFLPEFIGLGNGVARGFGVVRQGRC